MRCLEAGSAPLVRRGENMIRDFRTILLAAALVAILVPVGAASAQDDDTAAERAIAGATAEEVGQRAASILGRLEAA